jgi:hypothetical protein
MMTMSWEGRLGEEGLGIVASGAEAILLQSDGFCSGSLSLSRFDD